MAVKNIPPAGSLRAKQPCPYDEMLPTSVLSASGSGSGRLPPPLSLHRQAPLFLQYQHSTPRLLCQALSCTMRRYRHASDMGLPRRNSRMISQHPLSPYCAAPDEAAQPKQEYNAKAAILPHQPPYSGKTEGPAACSSQATNPFSCLNNFCL